MWTTLLQFMNALFCLLKLCYNSHLHRTEISPLPVIINITQPKGFTHILTSLTSQAKLK